MSISKKRQFGNLGEVAAFRYLKRNGYEIIEQNYSNNFGRMLGEIDVIAKDPSTKEFVFVEVKTRDQKNYANTLPEENITFEKLKKMSKIADIYLKQSNLLINDYRFDAISVWIDKDAKKARIKHIKSL
jgi:putative endonuclease